MRFSHRIFSLIVFCTAAHATSQVNVSQILSEIPSCALGCVTRGISSSPTWNLGNLTSICVNQTLQADLSACVQDACTEAELVSLAVANNQLCDGYAVQSRGAETITVGAVFISVTLLVVLLRCWSRYSIARELWWDDWSILLAALTLFAILVLDVFNTKLGFGEHLWEVKAENEKTLRKIFLSSEILYILVLSFTKASILFFYLRVFRRPVFRATVIVIIGFVTMSGIAFSLVILFQCSPVAGAWDKTLPSTCVKINDLAFASSGVSIAQDLIILFLPIPELIGLQMGLRKKLNVLGMFSIGIFACALSIIRLKFIIKFGDSTDSTWDDVTPAVWSFVEISVAMICACLPAIRALLSHWFPSPFETTSSKTPSKTVNSSGHPESKTRWANSQVSERANDDDDDNDDDNDIMMSQSPIHYKAGPIARFEDLDKALPPTPPKTPGGNSGFSEWPSAGRDSDEVQFVDHRRTVVPLRDLRGNNHSSGDGR